MGNKNGMHSIPSLRWYNQGLAFALPIRHHREEHSGPDQSMLEINLPTTQWSQTKAVLITVRWNTFLRSNFKFRFRQLSERILEECWGKADFVAVEENHNLHTLFLDVLLVVFSSCHPPSHCIPHIGDLLAANGPASIKDKIENLTELLHLTMTILSVWYCHQRGWSTAQGWKQNQLEWAARERDGCCHYLNRGLEQHWIDLVNIWDCLYCHIET